MIAPDSETLGKAVQSYVALGSGLDRDLVIRGNQKAPAPVESYATVLFMTDLQHGFVWTTESQTDAQATDGRLSVSVFDSSTVDFSVQFFRKGAHDLARRLRTWCRSPFGIEAAERRNLTFFDCGPVRQLDDVVSAAWEPRAGLDLSFGIVSSLVDDVVIADSVRTSLCYDGVPELHLDMET